jgi:hypothetical protein
MDQGEFEKNFGSELDKFEALIENLVNVSNQKLINLEVTKVDILEKAIELLRIRQKKLKNSLNFERFVLGKLLIKENKLYYDFPDNYSFWKVGAGTHPVNLQPLLIIYLLVYHRESNQVYNIIEDFVSKIWGKLDILDFKKTRTGVLRCFTNVRFAAQNLRDFGFLKFTHKEAYKTWILSLSGFLVASILIRKSPLSFKKVDPKLAFGSTLHPDIQTVWDSIADYEAFVDALVYICEPNVKVFSTFHEILKKAYSLLQKYWRVLQDEELSIGKRKEISSELIKRLDEIRNIDKFYCEFSKCVNVERLISEVYDE